MNVNKLFSRTIWLDSLSIAVAFIAAIETILAICDFGIKDFYNDIVWWHKLLIILGTFVGIWTITAIVKTIRTYRKVVLMIHNSKIIIKEGDLFQTQDWKLIPMNEYYDTQVDDKIIAHNTLHGIFIDNYVEDIQELKDTITNAPEVKKLPKAKKTKANKLAHPLGRIIVYKDYLLLSFAHFDDNNQAVLTHSQYEACLRVMWKEISRTYANKPITIPLLGGGITRFDNPSLKNEQQLLQCILCTLRSSSATIKQDVTICLTKEAISKIDLYELKKQFK